MNNVLYSLFSFGIVGAPYLLLFIKSLKVYARLIFVLLVEVYTIVFLPIIASYTEGNGFTADFYSISIFISIAIFINIPLILVLWLISKLGKLKR
jgi:hypothetical protein